MPGGVFTFSVTKQYHCTRRQMSYFRKTRVMDTPTGSVPMQGTDEVSREFELAAFKGFKLTGYPVTILEVNDIGLSAQADWLKKMSRKSREIRGPKRGLKFFSICPIPYQYSIVADDCRTNPNRR